MTKYLLVLLLCAAGCGLCAVPEEEKPVAAAFAVTPAKVGDQVETTLAGETVTFLFFSETGIGGATIALTQGEWPKTVVLRLRYQGGRSGFEGLEGFALETARLLATGSLKEAGEVPFRFKDAKGKIDKNAPAAGTLDIVMKQTEPYLEIILPAHLLTGETEVKVTWVDFYRG